MKTMLLILTLSLPLCSWASLSTMEKLDKDYYSNPIPAELLPYLYQYSANHGSLINGYLREKRANRLTQYALLICVIDYTITNYRIAHNELVLYRGHGFPGENGMKVGSIINNEAYTSTTVTKNVALEFINTFNYATLDVFLFPNDSIPGIWVKPFSRFPHEDEVLLMRGLQFKIVAINYIITQTGQKQLVRHMMYQGQAPKNAEVEKALGCPK